MITLTSATQPESEIREALEKGGNTIIEEAQPEAPGDGQKSSEQPAKPGGDPAAPGGETVSASEAGKDKAQGDKPPADGEEHRLSRGNFKSKLQKAQDQVSRLQEDLDAERGSKTKLQTQLDEAKARLAALETKDGETATTTEKKDEGPARPKRPTRADYDYDEERFEQALAEYDTGMDAYNNALVEKRVADALTAREKKAADEKAESERTVAFNKFVERKDAGREQIAGWDETFEALDGNPIDLTPVMEAYVLESENPALLMYHFALDALNGDSAELKRFAAMHPVAQVREITRLEQRLATEAGQPATATPQAKAPTPKPTTVVTEKSPAKPKTTQVDEPIETVGSRAGTGGDTPEKAVARGDMKAYMAMRNRQSAAKHSGAA